MATTETTDLRPVRTRWRAALLVCGKCLKRQGCGKAWRRDLAAALADRTGDARARVIRTACLGLCPKRGLVVASGPGLAEGRVLVARSGAEPAGIMAVLAGAEPDQGSSS